MEEQIIQDITRISQGFSVLHSLLTEGLSNVWKGQAFEAHLESESFLFSEAGECLEECGKLIRKREKCGVHECIFRSDEERLLVERT